MAINVIRYRSDDRIRWGVVHNERLAPIEDDYPTTRAFMLEAAETGVTHG